MPSAAGKVDPPMWTLCIEVAFYALLPAVGWFASRRAASVRAQLGVVAAVASAGLVFCALAWWLDLPQEAVRSLPTQLPVFAAGMAVAVLLHDRGPSPAVARALLLGGAGLVVAHGAWGELAVLRDLPAAVGFAFVIASATATAD